MFLSQIVKRRNTFRVKIISDVLSKLQSRTYSNNRSFIKYLPYNLQNQKFKPILPRTFLRHSSVISESEIHLSDLEEFETVGKIVQTYLTDDNDPALADALDWCSKVFEYNLHKGKKNRGTAVVTAYKLLSKDYSEEGVISASILGWCVEVLQAFFIIADDLMDQSITRRGEPCWFRKPEVGLMAVNDALLMQSGVYKVLRKHFGNREFYNELVNTFLQYTEKTVYGQCLDMLNNPTQRKPDYKSYTMKRYQAIVEYKTSYYTYCLPVHLAMHLYRIKTVKEFETTKDFCLKLGLLFQIQDDYLDCYGDYKITGKLGTDIIQGKCTWFAVKFLECANDSIKAVWMNSYGKSDKESVSKIMFLYEQMNMLDKYLKFEKQLYTELMQLIANDLGNKSMQDLFTYLLNKTYKRKK